MIPTRKLIHTRVFSKADFNYYKRITYQDYQVIVFNKKFAIIMDDSNLVLDHIKPIALGGSEFNKDNLQILCVDCNKVKTKQDHNNIAQARRNNKMNEVGQITLMPSLEAQGME